jgi:hypothetical protein
MSQEMPFVSCFLPEWSEANANIPDEEEKCPKLNKVIQERGCLGGQNRT